MSYIIKLCGGDGSGLVGTIDGRLVAVVDGNQDVEVEIKGTSAMGTNGNNPWCGWRVAWKFQIGTGTTVDSGESWSIVDTGKTSTSTYGPPTSGYSGTVDTAHATITFLLQLKAWDFGPTPQYPNIPNAPQSPVTPSDIGYEIKLKAGDAEETISGNFNSNSTSTSHDGGLVETDGHLVKTATFDFLKNEWKVS